MFRVFVSNLCLLYGIITITERISLSSNFDKLLEGNTVEICDVLNFSAPFLSVMFLCIFTVNNLSRLSSVTHIMRAHGPC
jgi:hypothetical protein